MSFRLNHADLTPVRTLGSGRTGTVKLYRSSSSSSLPFVAVKSIPRSSVTSSSQSSRIFREKAALQAFSHPNILSLISTDKDEENLYFLLEPVLGGPLHKHFRASPNGRLAANRVKFYAAELGAAVMSMQRKGYVHRDIKASNVLLGREGRVVLADFGYAKKLEKGERTNTYCGTVHAMAPEVALRSEEGHGFEADWWSVGVLVYECLVGSPPFGYGDDRNDFEKKVAEGGGGVAFDEGVFAGVGRSAKVLIANLLTVDPAERKRDGIDGFRDKEFFEGGVVEWIERNDGGWEVGGNVPEFNEDLADLDVYEERGGEGEKEGEGGGGGNNVFAGF